MSFSICKSVDPVLLRSRFEQAGRVQIRPFLEPDCAARLRSHLEERQDWRLVINGGERVFEIDRAGQATLTAAQREELERRVAAAARAGFQFRFESVRVADDEASRRARASLLDEFALFMSSEPVLRLLRAVTGAPDIGFADAQATCYGTGHFLTAHDDDVAGKGRRVAYVLGLTQGWRADWGGLLLFHRPDGDIEEAWLPRMNALSLFAVPQAHSVSLVAPFAATARYSVTGWLRVSSTANPQSRL